MGIVLNRAPVALAAVVLLLTVPAAGTAAPRERGGTRGGGELQIDESAPDENITPALRKRGQAALLERVTDYVEGSLARYDALKSESSGFRRQGWFPSLFLRDAQRDVTLDAAPGGKVSVTVHVSYAHRDVEQRIVIAPAERFELPGADKRFFCELLAALGTMDPSIARVRLHVWFAVLRADGKISWESRGGVTLTAEAARGLPAGGRTVEAVWPLLEEDTIPPSTWE